MKLWDEFEKALSLEEYEDKLFENISLHKLHYKKCRIDQEKEEQIRKLSPCNVLVITEPWCGDSLALVPILKKMSEINGNWEVKVLLRDSNLDLMDQFLTHGSRGIPIFLIIDDSGELLFKWGPRPEKAAEIFEDHREQIKNGLIEKEDVIKKIRTYYAKDRGVTTIKELVRIFKENGL